MLRRPGVDSKNCESFITLHSTLFGDVWNEIGFDSVVDLYRVNTICLEDKLQLLKAEIANYSEALERRRNLLKEAKDD